MKLNLVNYGIHAQQNIEWLGKSKANVSVFSFAIQDQFNKLADKDETMLD